MGPIVYMIGRIASNAPTMLDGLSSGEGLIHEVRDPAGEDDGAQEKRLFIREEEFARVLSVMKREGNILGPVLRSAWDDKILRTLTRSDPVTEKILAGLKAAGTDGLTGTDISSFFDSPQHTQETGNYQGRGSPIR